MSTISRRTFLATIGLTALAELLAACGGSAGAAPEARSNKPRQNAPPVAPDDVKAFAAGHNRFGLALYQLLGGGNLFFSPYSIAQVLTMTSAGARGQTAQQMVQALRSAFPQERLHPAANALDQALSSRGAGEDGFHLEIANSIWGQQGFVFQPEFLDTLATNYGAGLRLLDFKAAPEPSRATINATIAEQTHDKITDLLPAGSIDANTRLVLANAIYFNAKWVAPFAKESTRDGTFNPDQGGAVTTPMMTNQANYSYMSGQGFQAIALPYRGGVSMLALVPDAGQLAAFEAELDDAQLQGILDGLANRQVLLTMPKFEYHSNSIGLRDKLMALGMADAFDPKAADFSGMDGQRDLFIGDGYHKAMLRVDEEGTEAAAATAINMQATSAMPEPPLALTIDRPFVFLIRDDATGALLFIGRIVNPKAG
ncbi:MAG TPA: serpin family protein [Roseiflexaceae bacterium]|nr:serpin family protein [Roseiflexaceae bacterium]